MKRQIVTILVVLMAIIGLSGMTAAQSVGSKKKCEDGNNGVAATLTVTGGHSDTYHHHPGDGKCNDKKDDNKDDEKDHKKDHKKDDEKDHKKDHKKDDNNEEGQPQ
jgi:hypothetical protein